MNRTFKFFWLMVGVIGLSGWITPICEADSTNGSPTFNTPAVSLQFGTYDEDNTDLDIHVAGGNIRVHRVWAGTTKKWSINPEHGNLQLSNESSSDQQYGRTLPLGLQRGPRLMLNAGGGVYRADKSASGANRSGADGNEAYKLSSALAARLVANGIQYGANSGPDMSELIIATADGYKWLTQYQRSWASYTIAGLMTEWGVGKRRVGQIVHDAQDRVTGYRDTNDQQILTFDYDGSGHITFIHDNAGRQLEYRYNAQGQLTTVIDADGVQTRYGYNAAGDISSKTVGDATGAPAEEAEGEEVTYTISYASGAQVASVLDNDGNGSNFGYTFDAQKKLYARIERVVGGAEIKTTVQLEHGLKEIDIDGEPILRVLQISEDSVLIDRHNRETYYDRDQFGRLIHVLNPDGTMTSHTYATQGWTNMDRRWSDQGDPWGLSQIIQADGTRFDCLRNSYGDIVNATMTMPGGRVQKWEFTYDTSGFPAQERMLIDPLVHDDLNDFVTNLQFNQNGQKTSEQDVEGHTWQYEYDNSDNITRVISPNTSAEVATYNAAGELTSYTSAAGFETHLEYNKRGLPNVYRETYSAGQEAVYRIVYNRRGLAKKIVDPLGNAWTYEYDALGKVKLATDPDGRTQRWAYNKDGRFKSYTDGNGATFSVDYFDTAPEGQQAQYTNAFGPIVKVNLPTFTIERTYDLSLRLVAQKISPLVVSPEAPAHIETYQYDVAGRLIKEIDPAGKEVAYTYDPFGRILTATSPGWGTSSTSYSADFRTETYTDPIGNSIVRNYDRIGQVLSERRADNTIMNYTYDEVGNLISILNSNNQLQWFTYDPDGRQTKEEIYAGATHTGTPIDSINYHYNLRGDLTSYDGFGIETTYGLDAFGRAVSTSVNYGPFTKSHNYTFLRNGLRDTYTSPDGVVYQYQWDAADQLQGISIPNEGSITYGYNIQNWNQPISITFPGGGKREFTYDALGRQSRALSLDPASNPMMDYKYSYLTGELVNKKETEHGTYNYSYDGGYRIVASDNPTLPDENYSYDAFGNRSSGAPGSWTYNPNGAVTSANGITYEYDFQGNRTSKTGVGSKLVYSYDQSDRLVAINQQLPTNTEIARYGYDGSGQRVWKEVGGIKTYYYYTAEGLAGEFDATGNPIRSYLYEPDSYFGTAPLALKSAASGYNYYHTDQLGTPQKLSTRSGSVTWSGKYSAFGQSSVDTEAVVNPIRFPGQYFDQESGLHQNLMRDYDPELGAYLEQDPYGILTGPNRYGYAYGNPIELVDPTGEFIPALIFFAWEGYDIYLKLKLAYEIGVDLEKCLTSYYDPCVAGKKNIVCREAGHSIAGKVGETLLSYLLLDKYKRTIVKGISGKLAPVLGMLPARLQSHQLRTNFIHNLRGVLSHVNDRKYVTKLIRRLGGMPVEDFVGHLGEVSGEKIYDIGGATYDSIQGYLSKRSGSQNKPIYGPFSS